MRRFARFGWVVGAGKCLRRLGGCAERDSAAQDGNAGAICTTGAAASWFSLEPEASDAYPASMSMMASNVASGEPVCCEVQNLPAHQTLQMETRFTVYVAVRCKVTHTHMHGWAHNFDLLFAHFYQCTVLVEICYCRPH